VWVAHLSERGRQCALVSHVEGAEDRLTELEREPDGEEDDGAELEQRQEDGRDQLLPVACMHGRGYTTHTNGKAEYESVIGSHVMQTPHHSCTAKGHKGLRLART
jgi:hypothetical protein